MRKTLTLFLLAILLSCNDENTNLTCGVADPAEDLPWLKSMIQDFEAADFGQYTYIQQAYYRGQPVFIVNNCCAFCMTIVPVYDCDGNLICNLGECVDEFITSERLIWASANTVCEF